MTCERTRTAAERHDTVVTLLPDPIAEDHVACIRAGATAVADANGEPRTIAAVLDAAATDQVLIPSTTFQRLVAIARSVSDEVKLAQAEIDWLSQPVTTSANSPKPATGPSVPCTVHLQRSTVASA